MAKAATKAKPAAPTKAVATVKKASTALVDESAFEDYASTGFEGVTSRDIVIPRLTILQALSPQVQKREPEYIKGAEVGQFCDTATNDLYDGEIEVIPCFYARIFLEWAPRASGKGLVHNHGVDASILEKCRPDEKNRMILPNGNLIAETATFYVMNVTGGMRRSFIPLSSTQLKAARKWMTLLTNEKLTRSDGSVFTPPIFFRSWKATVIEQSNAEGNWLGWKFDPGTPILEIGGMELLAQCKEFFEQARDGVVTGDVNPSPEDIVAASSGAM